MNPICGMLCGLALTDEHLPYPGFIFNDGNFIYYYKELLGGCLKLVKTVQIGSIEDPGEKEIKIQDLTQEQYLQYFRYHDIVRVNVSPIREKSVEEECLGVWLPSWWKT